MGGEQDDHTSFEFARRLRITVVSVDYRLARRLQATGVPCTLDVVDGAFHGFDAVFRTKPVTRRFLDEQVTALTAALFPTTPQRQASP